MPSVSKLQRALVPLGKPSFPKWIVQANRMRQTNNRPVTASLGDASRARPVVRRKVRDTPDNALPEQLCIVLHSVSSVGSLPSRVHDRKDLRGGNRVINVEWQYDKVSQTQIANPLPDLILADDNGGQVHGHFRRNESLEVLLCDTVMGTARTAQANQETGIEQYGVQSVAPRIFRTHSAGSSTSFHASSPRTVRLSNACWSKFGE